MGFHIRSITRSRGLRPWLALTLALGLTFAACSGDDSGSQADSTNAESTESSTGSTRPACPTPAKPDVVASRGSAGEGDLISTVAVEPGPHSRLTAVLTAESSRDVTLDVVARSSAGEIDPPTSPASTNHEVALVGMTAETRYEVEATATAADGTTETVDLTFSSGSLPADLPPLTATVSTPAQMSPGVTLFDVIWWGGSADADCEQPRPEDAGWVVGVNAAGEVVWYYDTPLQVTDVSPTPQGTLLLSVHEVIMREIDMLGNDLSELASRVATDYVKQDLAGTRYVSDLSEPADVDSAHHELYELANGNLLTLSTEIIDLDPAAAKGICDGVTDPDGKPIPDPEGVVGDVAVELTRDGDVVNEWPLSDYFDPIERHGSDMCVIGPPVAPPNWFYPQRAGLRDWTHANAVVLDEKSNTLMVSSRHLDAIIGIRYAADASGPAGELLWDLSPDGNVSLSNGEFSYHGHAVEPQPDGTILYYDNGNLRPGTAQAGGQAPTYSRAVQYRIDPATRTATQIWEHRDVRPDGTPQFAGFLGDADKVANGNVLITHGGAATATGLNYSRIVEVAPDYETGENTIVFDLQLGDGQTVGYTAYRAERLPSLYFGPPS